MRVARRLRVGAGRIEEAVDVKTGALSPEYSSFNATVVSDAGAVNQTFYGVARSRSRAKPRVADATRITRTPILSDDAEQAASRRCCQQRRHVGRPVRYGGVQFGTRCDARADVIASSELATSGLAVLPTVADAMFAAAGDPGESLAQQNLSVNRSWRTGSLTCERCFRPFRGHRCADDCDDAARGERVAPISPSARARCGATMRSPATNTVPRSRTPPWLAARRSASRSKVTANISPTKWRRSGSASHARWVRWAPPRCRYASSRAAEGTQGWLARVGFEHQNDLFSVALRSRLQSREFREVGGVALDRPNHAARPGERRRQRCGSAPTCRSRMRRKRRGRNNARTWSPFSRVWAWAAVRCR